MLKTPTKSLSLAKSFGVGFCYRSTQPTNSIAIDVVVGSAAPYEKILSIKSSVFICVHLRLTISLSPSYTKNSQIIANDFQEFTVE